MDLKNTFGELVDKLRKARPVIHEITNYVTAESCADAALAAGASPVMADEPEEVIEITAGADALVLNLGTLSFNKQIAMERAAQAAKTKGIPVVLDPVGVMASTVRLNFALKLLNAGYIDIVRGNHSECQALLLGATGGRGVDNMEQGTEEGEALRTAKDAAMLVAAALGVVIMGQSAELAANFLEKKDGPGMFKVRLIDAIYHVTTKWNLVNLKPEEKVS